MNPTDLENIKGVAEQLKQRTELVLTSTSKNEAEVHEQACDDLTLELDRVDDYFARLLEEKRRDMADTRNMRNQYKLLRKELAEHAKRAKNLKFSLIRGDTSL